MKNLLYLLMFLPFAVKAQGIKLGSSSIIIGDGNRGIAVSDRDSLGIGYPTIWATLEAPARRNIDTVKVVMLVSDTSTVERTFNNNIAIGYQSGTDTLYSRPVTYQMQDTRPFMMYGYQTSTGELLDAYKQKLSKNIVMWIAYKTK